MVLITASFSDDGVPATGLSATIRIRDLSDNSLVVTDASMTEVGDGFYKYDFTTYDNTKDYSIRCDGSSTLTGYDRYTFESSGNTGNILQIKGKLPTNNIADQTLVDNDLTSIEGKIDILDSNVDDLLSQSNIQVELVGSDVADLQAIGGYGPANIGMYFYDTTGKVSLSASHITDVGTYNLMRYRDGVQTAIVAGGIPSTFGSGCGVFASVDYSDGNWQGGDIAQVIFFNQEVTIGTQVFDFPLESYSIKVINAIQQTIDGINSNVDQSLSTTESNITGLSNIVCKTVNRSIIDLNNITVDSGNTQLHYYDTTDNVTLDSSNITNAGTYVISRDRNGLNEVIYNGIPTISGYGCFVVPEDDLTDGNWQGGDTYIITYMNQEITVGSQVFTFPLQISTSFIVDGIESTVNGIDTNVDTSLTNQSNIEGKIDVVQTDLDNPTQYQADVSALATEANATSNTNNIISEVDANETKIDTVISDIAAQNDITVGEVWDYLLTSILTNGSIGKLIKDNLDEPVSNSLTELEMHTTLDNYTNKDDWKADVSLLATESNATSNKNEVITEVNGLSQVHMEILISAIYDIHANGSLPSKIPLFFWDLSGNFPLDETNITSAGTYSLIRIRNGVVDILETGIPSIDSSTAQVYITVDFSDGNWQGGDSIAINFNDVELTVDAQVIPVKNIVGTSYIVDRLDQDIDDILTDTSDIQPKVAGIDTQVDLMDTQLDDIEGKIDILDTVVDGHTTDLSDIIDDLAQLQTDVNNVVAQGKYNYEIIEPEYENGRMTSAIIIYYTDNTKLVESFRQQVTATYDTYGNMENYELVMI